jgi:hypothetical protein
VPGTTVGSSSTDQNAAQKINAGKGSGSVPQSVAQASKGKTVKGGMASKLASGTRKTGKQPRPGMNKGPLRP